MKTKQLIIDNPKYLKIILLIKQNKNYNEVLSRELEIKPSSTYEHLKYLERQGFIISKPEEERFNKTIYSVNYEKIIEEFILYLRAMFEKTMKDNLSLSDEDFLNKFEQETSNNDIFNTKNYLNNPYLLSFFKELLSMSVNVGTKSTLKELFSEIINKDVFFSASIIADDKQDKNCEAVLNIYNIIQIIRTKMTSIPLASAVAEMLYNISKNNNDETKFKKLQDYLNTSDEFNLSIGNFLEETIKKHI